MFETFVTLLKSASRAHVLYYRIKHNGRVIITMRDMQDLSDTQDKLWDEVQEWMDDNNYPGLYNGWDATVWAVIDGHPVEYWMESDCC